MRPASFPVAVAFAALFVACSDNLTPAPTSTDPALVCVPNLDGRIDYEELKVGYDVPVSYLAPPAGQTRTMDPVGAEAGDGRRVWDWATDDASDKLARIAAGTLADKWFAASFPKGQFTVPADLGGTLQAVNSIDATGMYIHGFASTEQDPAEGRTLYVYDPPVKALTFPVQGGAQWTSTGIVRNGLVRGLPYASSETYEMKVDASGELKLPDVTFKQAHRVSSLVTIVPAVGPAVTQRQVAFYFECFGEVARMTSGLGEPEAEFTLATEVRRFSLAKEGRDPYEPETPVPLACAPNRDGKIDSKELKVGHDLPVSYLVPPAGTTQTVSTVTAVAEGTADWAWTADDPANQVARIAAGTLAGKWFAAKFPNGQFTVPADLAGSLQAVNSIDATGMYIHGFASTEENPPEGQTLYTYDPPIKALVFPLKKGSQWTSTSTVRHGKIRGVAYASRETYDMKVDAQGTLRLPDFTFEQALRVNSLVTIVPAVGPQVTQRQVAFYSECYGEVARATSRVNESDPAFTVTAETRRLSPPGRIAYEPAPPVPLACAPNADSKLSYDELKVGYGLSVPYRVPQSGSNPNVGALTSGGAEVTSWDWTGGYTNEQIVRISAGTLVDKWFASSFPNAQFVVPADVGGTLYAVNSLDASGMWIHGFASAAKDPATSRTLYQYEQPIQAMRFPLEKGAKWTSTGTVKFGGTLNGNPYPANSTETYTMEVDALGRLKLPDLTFDQAYRLRTHVAFNLSAGLPFSTRQVAFYSECFGEVARAASAVNEPSASFTVASEVRRLALP